MNATLYIFIHASLLIVYSSHRLGERKEMEVLLNCKEKKQAQSKTRLCKSQNWINKNTKVKWLPLSISSMYLDIFPKFRFNKETSNSRQP